MSYSVAEAKITEASRKVAEAHERLRALAVESSRISESLDRIVSDERNVEIVRGIDQNATGTDPLWDRLKERKVQVVTDLQAVRASAQAIVAAIEIELG